MSADTKSLRNRMKSVDSTLHLTKAMGLVASSKIRKANEAMMRGREYAKSFEDAIIVLASSSECKKSVYMRKNEGRMRIIVIAGDRGLAGGYNANIFRTLREYPDADVIPIGKRAFDYCRQHYTCTDLFSDIPLSSERFSSETASKLSEQMCRDFADKKFGSLMILSTRYVSMLSQEAFMKEILPLSVKTQKENAGKASIIFEPDEITVLNTAIPKYVAGIIAMSIRESFASEVAARRMAMDSAGKNANEMIAALTLKYNRARQSSITQEITEIVAGSGR